MAPAAPPVKPTTRPGTKPAPSQPTERPKRFPDPFRPMKPGTDPIVTPKPKACSTGRRMEAHLRAQAVVDRLLEAKLYARPDPDLGAKPTNPQHYWKKLCGKCGKPYMGAGHYCPACKPMQGMGTTPASGSGIPLQAQ